MDREKWLMTPQTVNAYYHPLLNEIVFPAAILQPPFFTADADDAVNYGGIGAVIGHEIGHGFDDQGSQYDGSGLLRNWWTEDDRTAFEALTSKLVAQFDALSPTAAPGHNVNGKLTLGENIGDLGGLTIALQGLPDQPRRPGAAGAGRADRGASASSRPGLPAGGRSSGPRRPSAGSPPTRTPPTSSAPTRSPRTWMPSTRPSASPSRTACGCRRRSASASGEPATVQAEGPAAGFPRAGPSPSCSLSPGPVDAGVRAQPVISAGFACWQTVSPAVWLTMSAGSCAVGVAVGAPLGEVAAQVDLDSGDARRPGAPCRRPSPAGRQRPPRRRRSLHRSRQPWSRPGRPPACSPG